MRFNGQSIKFEAGSICPGLRLGWTNMSGRSRDFRVDSMTIRWIQPLQPSSIWET